MLLKYLSIFLLFLISLNLYAGGDLGPRYFMAWDFPESDSRADFHTGYHSIPATVCSLFSPWYSIIIAEGTFTEFFLLAPSADGRYPWGCYVFWSHPIWGRQGRPFYMDSCNETTGCTPFVEEKNVGNPPSCPVGNPVNQTTGNKYQVEIDFKLNAGTMSLSFLRYYNSHSLNAGQLGSHWRSNFDRKLHIFTQGHTTTESNLTIITAYRPDGKHFYFTYQKGVFETDQDVSDRIEQTAEGWHYITSNDEIENYDNTGKLLSISNRAGVSQTMSYDDEDRLIGVTDNFGRSLSFTYHENNRLKTLTTPNNQIYTYSYNVAGNLAQVKYPDTTQRQYVYKNSNFPNALTGIINEKGDRFATWTYDEQGRVTSSQHAGEVEKVAIVYNGDSATTVTDSLGKTQTYHFSTIHGVRRVTRIDGGPCLSCGDQSSSMSYDANGFLASKTDFNGNTTTYINNERGLEISRTEAVGTPQERTITTEWHLDFRLPIKITEPGKVTTLNYDAAGNLLSRLEQVKP